MLSVPHALVGAALGSQVGDIPGQAIVAFGVGWASHYVLDSLPHWDRIYRHTEKLKVHDKLSDWPKYALVQGFVDVGLVAIIVGSIIFYKHQLGAYYLSPIFWGAVGGMLPDILDNVPFWSHKLHEYRFFQRLWEFHHHSHISEEQEARFPDWAGLFSQLIMIGLSLRLLLK